MLGFLAIPQIGRIVLIAGTIALAFGIGWKINGWRLEAQIADLKSSYAKAYAEAQKAARDRENDLQNKLSTIRRTKDAEISNIRRGLDIALNSLRNRPDRASLPTDSVVGGGCTGSGLARGDAQFLARYAADAAELQSSFQACVRAYDAARKSVE